MSKKLFLLTSFVLVLALAGTNVVFGATVWEGAITDDNDDVEQQPAGNLDLGSSDLEILDDQVIGLRFLKVLIPPGATIDNAYIVFVCDETKGGTQPVNCIIDGQLTPNSPVFTSSVNNVSDRPRTAAQALWQPGDWTTVGQVDQTSNIAVVIDEIVNQPGWTSGNALVLILNDDPTNPSVGIRCAEAGPGGDAPLLHIEWSMGQAKKPSPADGAIEVSRDVVLSWKAGVFAAPTNGHKVYFSGNLDDVTGGIGGITQSDNSYDPGRLDFGTTYYWRIDEVNGAPDYGVYEGKVWRFTTELLAYPVENITATASSEKEAGVGPENTINGSGLDDNDLHSNEEMDMWLSGVEPLGVWIEYEFDKIYKLHQMWVWNYNQTIESILGFGFRDVTIEYSTNGTDYTTLGTTVEFAQAPGAAGYAHDTVDFGGLGAKYVRLTATSNWGGILPQYGLSEVRFLYIPVSATEPYPDSGATGVVRDVVLGWNAGREAATHDVYISTDEQAVIDGTAPVVTVAETSYGPLALDLSTTHYWRVDEVNEAETMTTWPSALWSFTTSDHIVVDDFESYNDLDPGDPASKRIF
ncbi:MAG: discoidin domain-containing protein, partial [Planctomycetota bacterium]